ncbi:hypothetical protein LTR37_015930 [Vermiconidia calcicola]|uniref:Uncharacterized protein n=1 Tax=Vermiconidia calcicola TaxID=1690605 RepID=A0ACC3MPB0_9PEZI|nr:hypothetical protein LTR37_015930 [Vermiconidia calcicola]
MSAFSLPKMHDKETPPNTPTQSPSEPTMSLEVTQEFVDKLQLLVAPKTVVEGSSKVQITPTPVSVDSKTEEERLRASREEYKSINEVWDKQASSYIIADSVASASVDELDEYLFIHRKRSDRKSLVTASYVDIKSKHLQEILINVLGDKDAANDNLDDRRFDAEIALANDRRAFQVVQERLVERSHEAEARSQHHQNLLTEALAQMASDRETYRLTLSISPEADFLLLRVVTCEGSQIRLRDRILSPSGADDLFEQLQRANHDIKQYVIWVGMARQVLARRDTTYSTVREAWHLRQVLWVLPAASYTDIRRSWVRLSDHNATNELERKGITLSVSNGRLQYSDANARHAQINRRKRKRTTRWPRARSRSRSPRGDDRARPSNCSRSPVRGRTEWAKRSPSVDAQDALDSADSAVQLAGGSRVCGPTADIVFDEESMQTVKRIEDIMENE